MQTSAPHADDAQTAQDSAWETVKTAIVLRNSKATLVRLNCTQQAHASEKAEKNRNVSAVRKSRCDPLAKRGHRGTDDDRLKCVGGHSADEQIQDMCQPSLNPVKCQTHRLRTAQDDSVLWESLQGTPSLPQRSSASVGRSAAHQALSRHGSASKDQIVSSISTFWAA